MKEKFNRKENFNRSELLRGIIKNLDLIHKDSALSLAMSECIVKRGKIHGIWFTQEGGLLHPAIIPNLSSWVAEALDQKFEVVLWTNTKQIAQVEIERLKTAQITIKDHSECKDSRFYKYFEFFLSRGIAGDKAAFALASDVLRMAILEKTEAHEYYIYVDPNDTTLINLKKNLAGLDKCMIRNSFGFSFYVAPIMGGSPFDMSNKNYELRNDVLIGLKALNIEFFNDYFRAYQIHLEAKYKNYYKPTTDEQAQKLAREITNQTGDDFFMVALGGKCSRVVTTFGNYKEISPMVHCLGYFHHERRAEHANTWLPIGDLKEETEWYESLIFSKKTVASIDKQLTIAVTAQTPLATESNTLPAAKKPLIKPGFLLL
jgi:hypothetical protein